MQWCDIRLSPQTATARRSDIAFNSEPVVGLPLIGLMSMPQAPKYKMSLGLLPTPLHRFKPPSVPDNVEMYVKRENIPVCMQAVSTSTCAHMLHARIAVLAIYPSM